MPTDRDKGAYYLIIFGSLGLSWQLSIVSWNPISSYWSWYVAIPLIAGVVGWALALSEFLPFRSTQK